MKLSLATVRDGGIIEHLASPLHKEKTEIFWTLNKIPAEKKTQFIVNEEDFNGFKEKALFAVKCYEERAYRSRTMELQKLQRLEHQAVSLSKEEEIQRPEESHQDLTGAKQIKKVSRIKKTMSAHGPGLTSVTINEPQSEEVGNIHTGATPPWLQDDSCTPSTSGEIGPSMKDFEKHLASEAKSKLPANRVGAGFNRNAPTAANWLPSFGQVWIHGRRSNTKQTFLRGEKKTFSNSKHSKSISAPKRMKFKDMSS